MPYRNPVYPHSAPDPFVLKFRGEYWCYFTGIQPDERCFGILHSSDLTHWAPVGSAMDPLPGKFSCYWAPEVVYRDGVFYMYYSVGNEEHMHIRVATSSHPGGPFVDSGVQLTSEPFAIDAHIFIDDDDQWYLFYATDYLDVERAGTGTAMDRMLDPFTLAGKTKPVTRARYDWQIYDPHRKEKGGVRWHTVEGPFVLKHNGRYYQMFSGGNWQNESYGVAYGVTDRIDTPQEWDQPCDGSHSPLVLRTLTDEGVIGPGHNSVVRGLDNRELYCVYHRWQQETRERVLAIDRMGWEAERLVVYGPSSTPQPDPAQPTLRGFQSFLGDVENWSQFADAWRLQAANGLALASLNAPVGHFLLEVSLRFERLSPTCQAGLALLDGAAQAVWFGISPGRQEAYVSYRGETRPEHLPEGFAPEAFHLLRLETTPKATLFSIDENRLSWRLPALTVDFRLQLFSQQSATDWAGFALTTS